MRSREKLQNISEKKAEFVSSKCLAALSMIFRKNRFAKEHCYKSKKLAVSSYDTYQYALSIISQSKTVTLGKMFLCFVTSCNHFNKRWEFGFSYNIEKPKCVLIKSSNVLCSAINVSCNHKHSVARPVGTKNAWLYTRKSGKELSKSIFTESFSSTHGQTFSVAF